MTQPILESENEVTSFVFEEVDWAEQCAYRCHICLVPEDDGGFSAIVLNLPGAASCGDTKSDAMANVEESIRGLVQVYEEHGDPIPWQDSRSEDIPPGAEARWILLNV